MTFLSNYQSNAEESLAKFRLEGADSRSMLADAVSDLNVRSVLDVGCGAGQELIPFLERTPAFCVGIDTGRELGRVILKTRALTRENEKLSFVRAYGEALPFDDESFDVVICRIALPYMNNKTALAEIARVMREGAVFLLKTHAPLFYLGMIPRRIKKLDLKAVAYPLICLAGGAWHRVSGRQPENGFWQGKEVFQTRRWLEKECEVNNLRIAGELPDTNPQTPSYVIKKVL